MQVSIVQVSLDSIMRAPAFKIGMREWENDFPADVTRHLAVRNGLGDNVRGASWAYERGRQFGCVTRRKGWLPKEFPAMLRVFSQAIAEKTIV